MNITYDKWITVRKKVRRASYFVELSQIKFPWIHILPKLSRTLGILHTQTNKTHTSPYRSASNVMLNAHIWRHAFVTINTTVSTATMTSVAAADVTMENCLQVGIIPRQSHGFNSTMKDGSRLLVITTTWQRHILHQNSNGLCYHHLIKIRCIIVIVVFLQSADMFAREFKN